MRRSWALLVLLLLPLIARADGPKDNLPDNVRRVPPPGVKVPDDDRRELEAGLGRLREDIERMKKLLSTASIARDTANFLPDVEVYYKAVHDALQYDEFFNVKEIAVAKNLLKIGLERAKDLSDGKRPWTTQTGQVVRGYRSNIDGSVQPYGLVIPKDYDFRKPIRLDFWCHGRGETLSEVNFIQSCQSSPGQFASDKAIVLNLYGRYCCANKLAGEIDCFEALDHAKKNYKIDENRLVMRGFSMGGAAAWHFAVHYPSMWCAAAPGAGFSETPDFLNVFQNEKVEPTWYEKKLWHMYDCTDYALNLYNLPTVAYSGEIDKQKQAADIMEKAMKREGLKLEHIIGPKTGHSYEKGAKAELIEKIDTIAAKGRNATPEKIKFVTYTLRYNKCFWVEIKGLERHWERAQVDAEIAEDTIKISTKNVTHLVLRLNDYNLPIKKGTKLQLTINGKEVKGEGEPYRGDKSLQLTKSGNEWYDESLTKIYDLGRKIPGLQGPIDDAFLSSFLMVRPTGKPGNAKTGQWADSEMKHAIAHWRQQFRGEAPVKDDIEVTEDDIRYNNLILWGDPSSNAILNKIYGRLPITWKDGNVTVGNERFDAATHMPVLIYPNPLKQNKYVVLNSGFTFREYDYLNNARQVPKLPDFAIVDTTTPPNSRLPGKIVTAGFFDEDWKLPAVKK